MWLCEIYYRAFHVESNLALLFVLVFFFVLFFVFFFGPFSIVITSLGEERAGLCASRAFVCLFCTR